MLGKNNPQFRKNAIALLVLGFLSYYLYCVTVGEQINLLTTTLLAETGWTITAVTDTMTYGSLLSVIMVYIINTLFMKMDSKKVMVGGTIVVAICFAGMGFASTILSMAAFVVSWLVLRVIIVVLQHGTNFVCNNWWGRNRGKAMGIVTIGAPAASATFVALTAAGQNAGLKFAGIYYIIAVCVLILALLFAIFFRADPEQLGLHPDGDESAPAVKEEHGQMSIGEVLKNKDSWLVIVSFGIFTFGTTCITAYFVTYMLAKGVDASYYLPALSIGAIVGIPISFLLGVIDDKWGTPVASMVMGLLYIVGFLGMALTGGNTIGTIGMATVGYAAITGGCPNLNASINTHVFGRKNFLAATRVVMALQMVIAAFANTYMGRFLGAGMASEAYYGLCGMVLVAIILVGLLARKPAYDSPEAAVARERAGQA